MRRWTIDDTIGEVIRWEAGVARALRSQLCQHGLFEGVDPAGQPVDLAVDDEQSDSVDHAGKGADRSGDGREQFHFRYLFRGRHATTIPSWPRGSTRSVPPLTRRRPARRREKVSVWIRSNPLRFPRRGTGAARWERSRRRPSRASTPSPGSPGPETAARAPRPLPPAAR